jgi:hypothetical protein
MDYSKPSTTFQGAVVAVYLLDEADYTLLEEDDHGIEKLAAQAEEPGTIVQFPDIYREYPATDTVSATAFIDNIPADALIACSPSFDRELFPSLIAAIQQEGEQRRNS